MNKKVIASILTLTLLFALAGAGTMAWFTSQTTSTGNTFTAGTLTLGGIIGEEEVENQFARVVFDKLEPGQPPQQVATTTLKNVGSLPFYLYRMTASGLVDNNTGNNVDDRILDDMLLIDITIGGEQVYHGRLSQLVESNGGFFDPIYEVAPEAELPMVITAYMDQNAGNAYQGLSMTCDFTVFAKQSGTPVPGNGGPVDMGQNLNFSVRGSNDNTYVNFDWDWTPNDLLREYYKVEIKHETGDVTTGIKEERKWFIVNFYTEQVTSLDGIEANEVNVDWDRDIVKIKRNAFPAEWDGFEVKISGLQNGRELKSLPWQYWSLGR